MDVPFKLISIDRSGSNRAGVTLIEIMIASIVIGLIAAISFPTYKVVQQREKEKQLKQVLAQVRSAITGTKRQYSNRNFSEGYRSFVIKKGNLKIAQDAETARKIFAANIATQGYPLSPSHLIKSDAYNIEIATGTESGENVTISVDRRFLRSIPPHPFQSWYPSARWEFRTAANPNETVASANWIIDDHKGVIDIVSRGAGIALNGSRTDDW